MFIAIVYITLVVYLMNTQLVWDTLLGKYKLTLLVDLLSGIWTSMTSLGLFTLFITALLTGANLTLVAQRFSALRSSGNLHFVVGGSSLLGLVGSGCVACGLPLISLFGLAGSLAFLPLRGAELSFVAVLLLSLSFYLLLQSFKDGKNCEVKITKT